MDSIEMTKSNSTTDSPDRISVLLVGPSTDIVGGQAIQAQRLLNRLRESKHLSVDFLAVNPPLPGQLQRLQKVKYVRTIATTAAYFGSLMRHVRRYDVVHAFSASYYSYLLAPLPAMLVARLFGRRTVLNYRSGEAEDHLANWRTAVPTMRRYADSIVVPSGYLMDVFGHHGLATVAIANFVDIDRLPFRLRNPLRPRFFANRNHEKHYNIDCTLRAFSIIQRSIPYASITIAGDGTERMRLEAIARELELRNVDFIGQISPDEMARQYNKADIYINTPNIDNMPGSIIEAFACGLPVVTTNAGGIPWMVENEVTGMIVERDDHASVAKAALRLLDDTELATRVVRNARQQCESLYNWDAVQRKWEELYFQVAGRSGHS